MFTTSRFKIHNPSRHKRAMLVYAFAHCHLTLKAILEKALATPGLLEQISMTDKKGKSNESVCQGPLALSPNYRPRVGPWLH